MSKEPPHHHIASINEWPSDSFTYFNKNDPPTPAMVLPLEVSLWIRDSASEQNVPRMFKISERNIQVDSNNIWADPKKYVMKKNGKICGFCRRNGEKSDVSTGHSLRDGEGNVVCPILREYVCPVCKATGDSAHTVTYCPIIRKNNLGQTPIAPTIMMKTSKYKSNGVQRY